MCRRMLSSYPPPVQLVQSPPPPFFQLDTCTNNHKKFSGTKLLHIPKASVSAANRTGAKRLQSSCLSDEGGPRIYGGRGRESQVQNLVRAFMVLPCKEGIEVANILGKDNGNWTISDFNDLLTALVLAEKPDLALKLYTNLSSYDMVPDSRTYSIMLRFHCMRNEVDEAKVVLDRMVHNGWSPDVAEFTTLIDSLCRRGKQQKAFEAFDVMNRIGCKPTIQTYNCLLKGLCYVGKVEEAFELLQNIKKTWLQPDIYTYTTMMDGFCQVGRSDEAMELLDEALKMGLNPTVVTYNTLFNGYCKEGRPVEGIRVLEQMKERKCDPDTITYRTVLRGLLIWGKIRVALAIYKEMAQNGFVMEDRLMNSLVRGLCRGSLKEQSLLDDAYELFDKMQKRGRFIEQRTYVIVIEALCMAKRVDNVLVNLEEMVRLGCIPKVITINRVIQALCSQGQVENAVLVLALMYENHKIPSEITYNLLVNELNRQKRSLCACNVYGAALVRGVIPHIKPQR